jgi:AAA-like domain/TIR domain
MPNYERSVFISYAWGEEREDVVNQIDTALQTRGIQLIRDKRDLRYKGSIREFMEQIGRGNCIVIVISDKYLRSANCMYELVEIANGKQLHDRIFPLVLKDANIYEPLKRIEYVKYWEGKRAELAEAIRTLDPANLQGIREDMDLYDRIRDNISGLTEILRDMNTLTPEMHQDSNFSILFEALEKRLQESQPAPAAPAPIAVESLRLYYPTKETIQVVEAPGRKRIFLSYKRNVQPDEALALELYEALRQEDDVFIDQIMPVGAEWRERIQHELDTCDFLVALLSANSAQSEMVEYEVSTAYQLARKRGKPGILPIRVAFTAPFDYPLSAYLNPLNWAWWRTEEDTPALIAELRTAIDGGQLSLGNLREKQAILQSPEVDSVPRPTSSAKIEQIDRPDGTMELESRFYIRRPGDAACEREVERGGATIVIKAPRQMGKSSLLVHAAAQARKLGREVAFLDFQLLDEVMLSEPERFFQGFCRWIADELDLDAPVVADWESMLGHVKSATKYVRRHMLRELVKPVTLVMDEVDRMLGCSFRSDFFGMLRSWHNNRATSPEWRKLDILLVISTEPYLLIDDLKQSPFNVGEVIRLEDFSLAQTAQLNDLHGSPFDPSQVQHLYKLLGGNPYLTRQALYRTATGESTPEALLAHAADENGPFGDHLRRHITRFSERRELARAMLSVISQQKCDDDTLYNRLHGAGLAVRVGERILPRCELYAQYFRERLSHG